MQDGKIIEYKVVSEQELKLVEKRVNEMLSQGWEPWGDLSVVAPVFDEAVLPLYSQAMVKRQL